MEECSRDNCKLALVRECAMCTHTHNTIRTNSHSIAKPPGYIRHYNYIKRSKVCVRQKSAIECDGHPSIRHTLLPTL